MPHTRELSQRRSCMDPSAGSIRVVLSIRVRHLSPCVSACDGLHLQRVANVCQNIPPVPASFQGTGEAIAQARLDDGDEESSP